MINPLPSRAFSCATSAVRRSTTANKGLESSERFATLAPSVPLLIARRRKLTARTGCNPLHLRTCIMIRIKVLCSGEKLYRNEKRLVQSCVMSTVYLYYWMFHAKSRKPVLSIRFMSFICLATAAYTFFVCVLIPATGAIVSIYKRRVVLKICQTLLAFIFIISVSSGFYGFYIVPDNKFNLVKSYWILPQILTWMEFFILYWSRSLLQERLGSVNFVFLCLLAIVLKLLCSVKCKENMGATLIIK